MNWYFNIIERWTDCDCDWQCMVELECVHYKSWMDDDDDDDSDRFGCCCFFFGKCDVTTKTTAKSKINE